MLYVAAIIKCLEIDLHVGFKIDIFSSIFEMGICGL